MRSAVRIVARSRLALLVLGAIGWWFTAWHRHTPSAQAPPSPIARSCTGTTRCVRPALRCARQIAVHGHATGPEVRGQTRTSGRRDRARLRADGAEPRHAHGTGRARRSRRSHRRERPHRSGRAQSCAKSPCARPGWVEVLNVRAEGDPVTAGQVLAEVYSPYLDAAQREFLLALESGQSTLIDAARDKLRALGFARRRHRPPRTRSPRERGASPFARRCTATS